MARGIRSAAQPDQPHAIPGIRRCTTDASAPGRLARVCVDPARSFDALVSCRPGLVSRSLLVFSTFTPPPCSSIALLRSFPGACRPMDHGAGVSVSLAISRIEPIKASVSSSDRLRRPATSKSCARRRLPRQRCVFRSSHGRSRQFLGDLLGLPSSCSCRQFQGLGKLAICGPVSHGWRRIGLEQRLPHAFGRISERDPAAPWI